MRRIITSLCFVILIMAVNESLEELKKNASSHFDENIVNSLIDSKLYNKL